MKDWIMGLFIFSFFAVGLVFVQSYFQTEYGLEDDVLLSADYNVYNETSGIITKSRGDLLNQSLTSGSASDATIQGAWATIRNLPNIIPISYRLLARASEDLNLPPWMLPIFVSMILTGIIAWIIYWIAGLVRRAQ